MEFFLVRIIPYSDEIWRFMEQISVFSPNMGKYGQCGNIELNEVEKN